MATSANISINNSKCSDECFDNICSPCLNNNKHTEGNHYCMECQDYYCSKCVAIHNNFPALSNHTVVETSDSKYKELAASFKPVPTERCQHHNTKLVDMYCTAHNKVGCSTCMTLEHKSCKLLYLPDSIDSITKTYDVSRFTEECENIKKAAIERIQVFEEQIKALSIKKDYVMKELKEFKNALRHWLDTIEENAVQNLANQCTKLELKWADEISRLRNNVNKLEQYEAKLKTVTKNEPQKFVCVSLGKEIVSATITQTEETFQILKSLTFTPTLVLKDLLTSQNILGTVSLTFEQEPVVRSDTSIWNRSPQTCGLFQRNKLKQQQIIAQLSAKRTLPTYGPELAKLMLVGARVVPYQDWGMGTVSK